MRTDIRYTPTDCFSTFPLPNLADDRLKREATDQGRSFYAQRQSVMLNRAIGFTKLYNLIHDPACKDEDVTSLREAVIGLDECILELYGLSAISCHREFEADGRGRRRFVIPQCSRDEIVRQLTNLNLKLSK